MTSPPSTWRNVLLIRHGATALNSDDHTVDRIRGWTDYPLSQQGLSEALKLAAAIALSPPDILFYSDLLRAERTAEIIACRLEIPLQGCGMAFRPWDVGLYVGANAAETVPKLAQFALRSDMAVPGGESFDRFRIRVFKGLRTVLSTHPGLVGIVTHHRVERLLKAWAKASYPENGAIDLDEFTRKGETTGHCEIVAIPVERLDLWWNWLNLHYLPNREDKNEVHRVHADLQPGPHADPGL